MTQILLKRDLKTQIGRGQLLMLLKRVQIIVDKDYLSCGDELTGRVQLRNHDEAGNLDIEATFQGLMYVHGAPPRRFFRSAQKLTSGSVGSGNHGSYSFSFKIPESFLPPTCQIAYGLGVRYTIEVTVERNPSRFTHKFTSKRVINILGLCKPAKAIPTYRTDRKIALSSSAFSPCLEVTYPFGNSVAPGNEIDLAVSLESVDGTPFPSGLWSSRLRIIMQTRQSFLDQYDRPDYITHDDTVRLVDHPVDLGWKVVQDFSDLTKGIVIPNSTSPSYETSAISCTHNLFVSIVLNYGSEQIFCTLRALVIIMGERLAPTYPEIGDELLGERELNDDARPLTPKKLVSASPPPYCSD